MSSKTEYWDSSYLTICFYEENNSTYMIVTRDETHDSIIFKLSEDMMAKMCKELFECLCVEIQIYNSKGKLKWTLIVGFTEDEALDLADKLSEYLDK